MNMPDIPVYECPVDGCDWQFSQLDYEQSRPQFFAQLVFDDDGTHLDTDAIIEKNAGHIKSVLREHLQTHDVFEWVDTVLRLNQALAQQHSGIRPHVYREQR